MKQSNLKSITIVVVCLTILSSCSNQISDPSSYKKVLPFLSGYWTGDNYAGTFQAYNTKHKFSYGTFEEKAAIVHLWDSISTASISGGTVKLNNGILSVKNFGSDGYYYHSSSGEGTTPGFSFDGSYQVFDVAGSATFPTFTDSLQSPNAAVTVTSPTTSSSLSKASGFTVTWSVPSGSTSDIFVTVHDSVSSSYIEKAVSDNGSCTITTSDLSVLSANPLTVAVTRVKYKEAVHNGKKIVMAVYSTEAIHCTLTN